jgi:hypothetical protein
VQNHSLLIPALKKSTKDADIIQRSHAYTYLQDAAIGVLENPQERLGPLPFRLGCHARMQKVVTPSAIKCVRTNARWGRRWALTGDGEDPGLGHVAGSELAGLAPDAAALGDAHAQHHRLPVLLFGADGGLAPALQLHVVRA